LFIFVSIPITKLLGNFSDWPTKSSWLKIFICKYKFWIIQKCFPWPTVHGLWYQIYPLLFQQEAKSEINEKKMIKIRLNRWREQIWNCDRVAQTRKSNNKLDLRGWDCSSTIMACLRHDLILWPLSLRFIFLTVPSMLSLIDKCWSIETWGNNLLDLLAIEVY
jgi:hypothetical protein